MHGGASEPACLSAGACRQDGAAYSDRDPYPVRSRQAAAGAEMGQRTASSAARSGHLTRLKGRRAARPRPSKYGEAETAAALD